MRLLYLVHDLNDPAVARRVRMLRTGGAAVQLAGFHRGPRASSFIAGASVIDLGRTRDGALGRRVVSVLQQLLGIGALRRKVQAYDLIVARNLEMLAIGTALRGRRRIPLVYEVLDIHRSLLGNGIASRFLRVLEARLGNGASLLLTSSPHFIERYFDPLSAIATRIDLVENKPMARDLGDADVRHPQAGPPWRIGWFGNLRCVTSLRFLVELARRLDGLVEVDVRGRLSDAEFSDTVGAPNVSFSGPYGQDELADIYRRVHFAWAIDYFEAGQNSSWLLPNRLYEAAANGCIPIALSNTATGAWLKRAGAGLVIDDPPVDPLERFLRGLRPAQYAQLFEQIRSIERHRVVADDHECAVLVEKLKMLTT